MYVCICNAINDKEIDAAIEHGGARKVSEVFRSCDSKPSCGTCVEAIKERLDAFKSKPVPEPDTAIRVPVMADKTSPRIKDPRNLLDPGDDEEERPISHRRGSFRQPRPPDSEHSPPLG